jgi:hypothetical protein
LPSLPPAAAIAVTAAATAVTTMQLPQMVEGRKQEKIPKPIDL